MNLNNSLQETQIGDGFSRGHSVIPILIPCLSQQQVLFSLGFLPIWVWVKMKPPADRRF